MARVLVHSFFMTVSDITKLTETLNRKAKEDKAAFARLEAGQAQLIDMSSKTITMIKESASVIITSIFEPRRCSRQWASSSLRTTFPNQQS